MHWIDTHTHLYLEQFDPDRDAMIQRAIHAGIKAFLLPNIDKDSLQPLLKMCADYPGVCLPMAGLHPTSVDEDFEAQLEAIEKTLNKYKFVGIGEIGIDLYWDKTFTNQQIMAFQRQLDWAKALDLPVAIHARDAFPLVIDLTEDAQDGRLKGVFHCFTGGLEEAKRMIDLNFMLGIGGVLTYKKSPLPAVIDAIPLNHLILETDSPYLPPVPHRGKRNESSFLIETAVKLAEIKQLSLDEVARITTINACKLFNINLI